VRISTSAPGTTRVGTWRGADAANVSIQVDESFTKMYGNRPVQIDIVGVGPVEHKRWETYSMTKYWEAGDTLRDSSKTTIVTLTIDPSKPEPQVVWADNAMWGKWMEGEGPYAEAAYALFDKTCKKLGLNQRDRAMNDRHADDDSSHGDERPTTFQRPPRAGDQLKLL